MYEQPTWMNRICSKCKYYSRQSDFRATCRAPDSKERIARTVRNPDGTLNYDIDLGYYTGQQKPLPCFELRPKPSLRRLPVAVLIGLFLWPVSSFLFLLVAHMGFAGVGFPPLPLWFVVPVIVICCAFAITAAVAWYRKEP
jgi:hypothetical protein